LITRVFRLPNGLRSPAAARLSPDTSRMQKQLARWEKLHGKRRALSILAHKLGRAVFYMLTRGTLFSMDKFLAVWRP
jgi:hypothetical protein